MPFSQAGRLMAVTTPLGADALLLETFDGTESLSSLFEFELGVLAPETTTVAFDALLGQSVTVAVSLLEGGPRFFNGIVGRITEVGQVYGPRGQTTFTRYRLSVVPKAWLLTHTTKSRIFQQKTIPDILKVALTGPTVEWKFEGTYEPRDYCTQYRETDFAFACRLMEEEGIYYYFKHANGSHTMVVADSPNGHEPVPGPTTVSYQTTAGGVHPDDRVFGWVKSQEIRSGKVTLWDHCFEKPRDHLAASKTIQGSVAVGTVTHKLNVANADLELYDYPGEYAQRFDGTAPGGGDRPADVQKIFQDNARTAAIRIKQAATPAVVIAGEGNVRHLTAGHKFTLADHVHANGEYVLTQVEHAASLVGAYTDDPDVGTPYSNRFRCLPAALPFVPPRVTPKAHVWGTQSAVVVGPAGEEIFTDKYARVKVQFPWDRDGKYNQDSACWCRVSTLWAGKQWGMIHIPRIGHEVVVAYEEGDPDRPIIVGSVYNAENMPIEKLPDDRTISGWKSRSTLQGTEQNYNQLMFEDKKGQEYIYFHAERDFHRVVENDDKLTVGFDTMAKGDQTIDIHNNQLLTVGWPSDGTNPTDGSQSTWVWNTRNLTVGSGEAKCKDGSEIVSIWNSQEVTIGEGKGQCKKGDQLVGIWNNQELIVGEGKGSNPDGSQTVTIWKDRTVTLKTGNDKLTIEKGNRDTKISMGNDTLTVSMGNITTKAALGAIKMEAMQSIEMKVGGNSIKIDQTGITINGIMFKATASAIAEVKGTMAKVSGDAMLMAKGGITMIN